MTVWTNQKIKSDGTEVCQFCQSIVGDIKKFIEEQKTQEQISHFLTTACGIIPKQSIAAECQFVAEFMLKELFQLIAVGVDPQMICSIMGLCTGSQDFVLHAPISQTAMQQNQEVDTVLETKKLSPLIGASAEPICTDCKKFFTDIKTMLTANKTEAEVEQLIDTAICSILGSLEQECKSLIHEFLPEIMEILASYYDPNMICQSLGVCEQTLGQLKNFLLFQRLQKMPLYSAAKQSSVETCIMCKAFMLEIQNLDRNKDVQSKVSEVIKTKLCPLLGALKDACQTTVDLYGPELFELLATELDPSTRCRSLGFCAPTTTVDSQPMAKLTPAKEPIREQSENKQPMAVLSPAKKSNDVECTVCQYIIAEVKSMISTNATEEEIKAALEKVCDYFPSSIRPDCINFIDTYGQAVIELLLSELDPQQICAELGLCNGQMRAKTTTTTTTTVRPPQVIGSTETCMVCETIVQYLEALLEQNSTIAQIEAILHQICGYVPSSMTQQCNFIVNQFGDEIIYFISTAVTPKQVCTLVHLCDGKKVNDIKMALLKPAVKPVEPAVEEEIEVAVKAPILGQNECTWGAAYWCASQENAKKCNAVDHCKRNVWNQ